jgi:hypothetical protein
VSESSLAGKPQRQFEIGQGEGMPVRIFNGHLNLPSVLLGLTETAVAILSVYLAVLVRFSGFSEALAAFHTTVGPIWPRAVLFAGVTLLGLAALGLYQLKQRTRFTGILVRLLIAVLLAQASIALIFYMAPSVYVGRGVIGLAGIFAFVGLALDRYMFLHIVESPAQALRSTRFQDRRLCQSAGRRHRRSGSPHRPARGRSGFTGDAP